MAPRRCHPSQLPLSWRVSIAGPEEEEEEDSQEKPADKFSESCNLSNLDVCSQSREMAKSLIACAASRALEKGQPESIAADDCCLRPTRAQLRQMLVDRLQFPVNFCTSFNRTYGTLKVCHGEAQDPAAYIQLSERECPQIGLVLYVEWLHAKVKGQKIGRLLLLYALAAYLEFQELSAEAAASQDADALAAALPLPDFLPEDAADRGWVQSTEGQFFARLNRRCRRSRCVHLYDLPEYAQMYASLGLKSLKVRLDMPFIRYAEAEQVLCQGTKVVS
mmetsp:Transcript_109281/g.193482  ORF Transcript_109281/g.193482 Transcript_109281/m.193482 type:complete len:277 (-) Transcript_109281:24-854(-)